MKLEAAKHVEAVGAMKSEDKELTGGCNGESEEEDSNRREIAEAVKVAMSSMSSCRIWGEHSQGRMERKVGCGEKWDASKRGSEEIRSQPLNLKSSR
ncbi:hypothetical protein LXL04_020737 [Taraxacum kok-saghyz]